MAVSSLERQMRTEDERRRSRLCRKALELGYTEEQIKAGDVMFAQSLYGKDGENFNRVFTGPLEWIEP